MLQRPDFGVITDVDEDGLTLECPATAPGLTTHDLVIAFENATAMARPGDELSGNPGKWPVVRGVQAVADAVVDAFVRAGWKSPETVSEV